MIDKLRSILRDHRYKVGIFVLLAMASAICIALAAARIIYTGTDSYANLVWNLFLAWIPFILAYIAYMLSWRKPLTYIVIPVFAFLWLIFFPNAPYILTDLQHLGRYAGKAPVWYDVILLIWFSWTGMLLGIVSLSLMQEIVKREIGRLAGWVFVLLVACLTGVGIYIGRFVRLNSWDILKNPIQIVSNVTDWLEDPSLKSIGFIALYTLFFIFVYLTLYAFSHILREGPEKKISETS